MRRAGIPVFQAVRDMVEGERPDKSAKEGQTPSVVSQAACQVPGPVLGLGTQR